MVALQEDIGLDVLVHGEPERNDMVQYFAERLRGFAATEHGWVQSYGTRYVRPPILFGDVSRPEPMTVRWAAYAQSRTAKPVKGMLTGPVTMLAWSFVRDDQPLAETARQVALALRDEVRDLEAAGIRIIQVDEPALRELLPLREPRTGALPDLGGRGVPAGYVVGRGEHADPHPHVLLRVRGRGRRDRRPRRRRRQRGGGPVADGDSWRTCAGPGTAAASAPASTTSTRPGCPSVEEMEQALRLRARGGRPDLLWVNPDCGLKTRGYAEVEPALRNMVEAARRVRATLPDASEAVLRAQARTRRGRRGAWRNVGSPRHPRAVRFGRPRWWRFQAGWRVVRAPRPAPITPSVRPKTGKIPRQKIKASVRFTPTGAVSSPASSVPSIA